MELLCYLNNRNECGIGKNVRPWLYRFRCGETFYRFLQLGERGWPHLLIPSVRAVRLHHVEPNQLLQRFGDLLLCEEDSRIQLRFSVTAPVWSEPKQAQRSVPLPWGISHIRADKVWRFSKGEAVKIAVVDTGIDSSHPDLQRCLRGGINILESSQKQKQWQWMDDNGHGTHIAGTIAASGEKGLTGVAPGAEIYSVKAFDQEGSAYISDIIRAIEWCVENGMHIINMSFGMHDRSDALFEAVSLAEKRGVLVVASAGNGGARTVLDAPARYSSAIAVGAINRQAEIASFSKDAPEVEIYAPGENILSAWLGGQYKHLNGSSMATAHVSGVLALMLALRPGLRQSDMKRLLSKSGVNKRRHIDAVRAVRSLFA